MRSRAARHLATLLTALRRRLRHGQPSLLAMAAMFAVVLIARTRKTTALHALNDLHDPIGHQAVRLAVNSDRGLLVRSVDQAEHLPGPFVKPVREALDVVPGLGLEVGLMGRGFHPFSILFAVSGSLMISTIRIPKP